jgi:hypothetical protein
VFLGLRGRLEEPGVVEGRGLEDGRRVLLVYLVEMVLVVSIVLFLLELQVALHLLHLLFLLLHLLHLVHLVHLVDILEFRDQLVASTLHFLLKRLGFCAQVPLKLTITVIFRRRYFIQRTGGLYAQEVIISGVPDLRMGVAVDIRTGPGVAAR